MHAAEGSEQHLTFFFNLVFLWMFLSIHLDLSFVLVELFHAVILRSVKVALDYPGHVIVAPYFLVFPIVSWIIIVGC